MEIRNWGLLTSILRTMAKRVITKIGDIFCVKVNNHHKRYLQYIICDQTCLNSDVIRVFMEKYPIDACPTLSDIVNGEVDFYSHCDIRTGIKKGLWEKVGHISNIGKIDHVIFKYKSDYTNVNIDNDWRIWKINNNISHIGTLRGDSYMYAYLGLIFHPEDIIHKLKTGAYPGVFAKFE